MSDWFMVRDDTGMVVRMVWAGPLYGPPTPADVWPAPCPVHERLTTPCEDCRIHALGPEARR